MSGLAQVIFYATLGGPRHKGGGGKKRKRVRGG